MTNHSIHPLQTRQWAQFRREWGNKVIEFDYGYIIATRIPKTKYSVGTFIKGPKPTKEVLSKTKKAAHENNLVSVKFEPDYIPLNSKERNTLIKLFKENNCVMGKTLFTPTTFVIDLNKSDEDLLKSFSSKTRYNIRLAERKGVKVVEDNSDKSFEEYLKLMRETVERQHFYAHSERYHRLMWKYLRSGDKPIAHLLKANYANKTIATWILFACKDTLYYPYGASSHKHKGVMASNLMMWEAIKLGKKLGLKKFDLWGREEGKGFTKFKEGYSPEVIDFLGSWDMVVNPTFYWIFRTMDTIRWPILRLKSKFTKPNF